MFLVCSRMMDPVFSFLFFAYVFLLGNWVYWCWQILITSNCYFLLFWCCWCSVCVCAVCFPSVCWNGIYFFQLWLFLDWVEVFPANIIYRAGFVYRYCWNLYFKQNLVLLAESGLELMIFLPKPYSTRIKISFRPLI